MNATRASAEHAGTALGSRANGVAAAILLLTAAFAFAKTGRDALFFQGRGLFDLPKAYMGIAVLSVPAALLGLAALRRLSPRRARVALPLLAALVIAGFHPVARPGGGIVMTAFFMFVPLCFGVLFSVAWLLAADLLEGAPRPTLARAYSLVGGASILGGVGAGLVARQLAPSVEPRAFLLIAAATLAASTALVAWVQSRFPPAPVSAEAAAIADDPIRARTLMRKPYPKLLLGVGMASSLVGILVDFQFYLAAATSGMDGRQNARFFANVTLIASGAALLVQLFVMPRLQRQLGVHGSLLVMPASLVAGSLALLGGASLATRSLLRIAESGLRSSIHRANWEQAFLPLRRAERVVAKVLVDGAAARVAEGTAAVLLYFWLEWVVAGRGLVGQSISWVSFVLVFALLVWVVLTQALRSRLAEATAACDGDDWSVEMRLPDT